MVAGSFTEEHESPVAMERLWKAGVIDGNVLMPKLLPELIASVDFIGDGGVGTIAQFNFTEAAKDQMFMRDRIDVIDSEKHVFKYTVIADGGLLGKTLKSYSYELKLEEAAGGGGTKGKVTVDYDTIGDGLLTGEEKSKLTSGLVGMMKAVEAFLQANPDQYA